VTYFADVAALTRKDLHPREAKRKLARTITTELHSAPAADEAQHEFDRVHKEGAAPGAVPTVDVTVNGQREVSIVDLVVRAFGKSKREARQLLAQNGVRVGLAGRFVTTIQEDVDYDRRPSPGRRQTDRTFSLTLGYRF